MNPVSQHANARTIALARAQIVARTKYLQMRAWKDRRHARWIGMCAVDPGAVISLAEVGQRVCLDGDAVTIPGHDEATNYTVKKVVGMGADAMHALQADDGTVSKWHRASSLRPAVVSPHAAALAAQKKQDDDLPTTHAADQVLTDPRRDVPTNASGTDDAEIEPLNASLRTLLSLADRYQASGMARGDAVKAASKARPGAAGMLLEHFNAGPRERGPAAAVTRSLSDRRTAQSEQDETRADAMSRLMKLAQVVQKERPGTRWSDALAEASRRDPHAAAAYLGR